MESKEFGLVAAQQLFNMESLHYGFWEATDTIALGNMVKAQEKYIAFLCQQIEALITDKNTARILDVGCGTGVVTERLLQMGYQVDGLVPSNWMARIAREKVSPYKNDGKGRIYESTFEGFVASNASEPYQVVFFSESYQYIHLQSGFDQLDQILSNTGSAIIFDFFARDGVAGKSPLGGGHSIGKFYAAAEKNGFKIVQDRDVTANMSPNMKLVSEVLRDRILPFVQTLDQFLSARYPKTSKLFKCLFKKRLDKLKFKYSTERNHRSFEKYKTYRLLVIQR